MLPEKSMPKCKASQRMHQLSSGNSEQQFVPNEFRRVYLENSVKYKAIRVLLAAFPTQARSLEKRHLGVFFQVSLYLLTYAVARSFLAGPSDCSR